MPTRPLRKKPADTDSTSYSEAGAESDDSACVMCVAQVRIPPSSIRELRCSRSRDPVGQVPSTGRARTARRPRPACPRSNRSGQSTEDARRRTISELYLKVIKTVMEAFDVSVPWEMLAKKRGSGDAADGDGLPMNLRHIQTGATGSESRR